MTERKGGGPHPGDPWHPDWESAVEEETPEEEWPYDESLTLSEAELEVADIDESEAEAVTAEGEGAEEEPAEEDIGDQPEVAQPAPEVEAEQPAEVIEEAVAELAAEEEPEVVEAEPDGEVVAELAEEEPEEAVAEPEEEAVAEVDAEEAEAEAEGEVVAEQQVEAVEEEPAELDVAELEPEEAVAEAEGEVVAEQQVEAVEEEPAELDVAELEPEEAVAEAEEEVVAEQQVEAVEEEPAELEPAEAEPELAEAEGDVGAEVAAEVVEEPAAEAAAEQQVEAAEEEPVEEVAELEPEVVEEPVEEVAELDAADVEAEVTPRDEAAAMDEFEVEELEAEPERMEAVEEISLEDAIEDEGQEPSEPTFKELVVGEVDAEEILVEEGVFEVVDLEDQQLRDDTAEHFFDALDFEEPQEPVVDELDVAVGPDVSEPDLAIDHDDITAEVPVVAETADVASEAHDIAEITLADAAEPALEPIEAFEFEVAAEFEEVSSSVDEHSAALAAFMRPSGATPPDVVKTVAEEFDAVEAESPEPASEQLEIVPDLPAEPAASQLRVVPVGAPKEDAGPLTPEEEIVAELAGDLGAVDFETFVSSDFEARDYLQSPTQEHIGLAEAVSEAGHSEQSALAAALPGLDHGHVGFDEFEEDLEFHDPEASERAEADDLPVEPTPTFESDLTLRMASALILVSLLVGALYAGGVVFLLFIIAVALASQIEFYTALRKGGYRPMVLFGLLGGLGALIGTYIQGNDVFTDGPIAVPAALGLTVAATFAWYGSQENPPHEPWRNAVATVFGVAWIPALLAFVLPMNEATRSMRFQLVFVLLVMVAAFDIGSYFVGRALGNRKLAPVVSPNKTMEGLIGGIVVTVVVALLAAALVNAFDVGSALALAAAVILVAPLGDLAESVIKRSLDLKDMGQLLPGHGGVLDRIDSYLFVLPVAYLVLRWTNLL